MERLWSRSFILPCLSALGRIWTEIRIRNVLYNSDVKVGESGFGRKKSWSVTMNLSFFWSLAAAPPPPSLRQDNLLKPTQIAFHSLGFTQKHTQNKKENKRSKDIYPVSSAHIKLRLFWECIFFLAASKVLDLIQSRGILIIFSERERAKQRKIIFGNIYYSPLAV